MVCRSPFEHPGTSLPEEGLVICSQDTVVRDSGKGRISCVTTAFAPITLHAPMDTGLAPLLHGNIDPLFQDRVHLLLHVA